MMMQGGEKQMEKATTLNVRVNPMVKARAEEVLSKLGVPMSTAINMYLNQISLTAGFRSPLRCRKRRTRLTWIR